MPERRLPTSAPAAAGPRRHSRRLRRRCRLLLLLAFALALLSVAYLSFSPHPNLPFREKQHGMAGMNNAGERMNQRYSPDDLSTKFKAHFSMTKYELEPFKRRKKSRKHCKRSLLYSTF
ncbi:hypothetical protein GUJ93_ZPchr0002g24118 [Zizania palustris]|uniref:Uncharacterized protein n=1 Tax=Zizania palustris TaxID=103762 RepID=A0A8J5RRV3_ZIZPA|nr:hypothetical protein GUJ93_ZPchr0002g24118 [Zizania palustris]